MITRNFNLNLYAGNSSPLVINANQYDSGEQWVFTLYDENGTQYTPSTGAIVGIKSDGLGIINTGSVVDGKVVINETQQMTAAVGKAVFELVIDDGTHGTANFVVLVEPKPGDNADLSETDISMIEQAIEAASTIKPYGSPLVASTVAGMTDHEKVYVYVGSETGYTSGNWYYWDGSAWTSGGVYNSVAVQTDTTLTVSGAAADAKKTGDEISDLKSQIEQSGGLTSAIKSALLQLAQKVAYIDENGQDYYDDLYDALYAVTSIVLNANSLSFGSLGATQQLTATTNPQGAVVTWESSDTSVATVDSTGLVTSVAYGSATITATAGGLSATCSVVIAQATVTSISAVYTQGTKVVSDIDSLNSLKSDLVVTASWSNGTTSTVADEDYALSGTLAEGTSEITVNYGGKTAVFNVTVTAFEYVWDVGKTTDSSSGLRLQNNQNRDRVVIGGNVGEHPLPYVQGALISNVNPIYIGEGITTLTVTSSVGDWGGNICYYDENSTNASKWTTAQSVAQRNSGVSLDLSSYAGDKYYIVILMYKNTANSENTTITFA